MRILVTPPRPSGHIVLVRLPDGAAFAATFTGEDSPRDITAHVAQLLLTGALDAAEQRHSGRPEPEQSVEAARVQYLEAVTPGAVREHATFTWAHLPSGDSADFTPAEVMDFIGRGISVELTAGVAADVPVPDAPPQDPTSD